MNPERPELLTARLMLRPPVQGDLDGFCALHGDPRSAAHLGGVKGRADAWRALALQSGSWALLGFGMFSVLERASGRWLGRVGPWCPEGWPGTEVGWGLVPSAWGQGYATEAARATMIWAREHLGWTDIIHCIAPDNTASQAVARRLGAQLRGESPLPEPFAGVRVQLWGAPRG